MPNWCEGVFKVRGARKNVTGYLRALIEELTPEVSFKDNGYEVNFESNHYGYFYLRGTKRAFIDTNSLNLYVLGNKKSSEEVTVVSISDFKQAWGIRPEDYVELSKKYDVDVHIFGYEKGMEFTQEVEIREGVIVKDIESKFDDYDWEVPFSHLGG